MPAKYPKAYHSTAPEAQNQFLLEAVSLTECCKMSHVDFFFHRKKKHAVKKVLRWLRTYDERRRIYFEHRVLYTNGESLSWVLRYSQHASVDLFRHNAPRDTRAIWSRLVSFENLLLLLRCPLKVDGYCLGTRFLGLSKQLTCSLPPPSSKTPTPSVGRENTVFSVR